MLSLVPETMDRLNLIGIGEYLSRVASYASEALTRVYSAHFSREVRHYFVRES